MEREQKELIESYLWLSQWWEKIYDGPRNIGQVYRFRKVMLNRERKERVDGNLV